MRPSSRILIIGLLSAATVAVGYVLLAGADGDLDPGRNVSVEHNWSSLLAEVPIEKFGRVASGPLDFPRDHGAHLDAPMETWNFSTHLRGESGESLGVQISLARLALVAPDAEPATSPWEMREFYRGHTILVRGDGVTFAEERLRRGFAGVAGYDEETREWRLDDWSMKIQQDSTGPALTIAATVGEGLAVELRLEPEKHAVAPDAESAGAPFRGYSMTRLSATGALVSSEGREAVEGVAWLDHLWGDLPSPTGPTAWDRLLLHVDDGSEISLVRTRRRDGGGTPSVDGYIVGPEGKVSQLASGEVTMEPLRSWSPDGASHAYPVDWRLSFGDQNEFVVSPLVDDQLHDFALPVWSGAVTARGELGSKPVEAAGTLQLNGYAEP